MNSNKEVLVTGAAGFIGAAVAKKMLLEGYTVVTVDNLSTGFIDNVPEGVIFYEGNLQDPDVIKQLEKYKFETIFHIAGQSSGEISFDDPVYDLQSNTQSTILLILLSLKINCKKFIYASTMSVYGTQTELPVDEKRLCIPVSFYSVGKLASENYMHIYKNMGIDFFSLRLFNVYGPGQNLNNMRQGMISIYLSQALENGEIIVKGDKNRFRDMIYIDDVVNAFFAAHESTLTGYNIYNVCNSIKITVEDVIKNIQALVDKNLKVEYVGSTPGDIFGIYGTNEKIRKELKWNPKIGIEEGMSRMYKWAIS